MQTGPACVKLSVSQLALRESDLALGAGVDGELHLALFSRQRAEVEKQAPAALADEMTRGAELSPPPPSRSLRKEKKHRCTPAPISFSSSSSRHYQGLRRLPDLPPSLCARRLPAL